jgi:hypothetical protein
MLPVLILDRAHMAYRRRPKCADLLRPTSFPFDQEIDDTTLAHVALHPRCPCIRARTIYAQPDIQGVQAATQRPQRQNRSGPSAAQLSPSRLVILSSQSRPRRLVVSGHRCSPALDRTRTRWFSATIQIVGGQRWGTALVSLSCRRSLGRGSTTRESLLVGVSTACPQETAPFGGGVAYYSTAGRTAG